MQLIATTYMELTALPPGGGVSPPSGGLRVGRERFEVADYLELFDAVGGPLGWDGRKLISPDAVARILGSPSTDIYVLRASGEAIGFCEFNRLDPPDSELKYFGLVPGAQGRQLGPYLLDVALRAHWRQVAPRRVWLHTDVLDHPKAIALYERTGFRRFALHHLTDQAMEADYRAAIGLPPRAP